MSESTMGQQASNLQKANTAIHNARQFLDALHHGVSHGAAAGGTHDPEDLISHYGWLVCLKGQITSVETHLLACINEAGLEPGEILARAEQKAATMRESRAAAAPATRRSTAASSV